MLIHEGLLQVTTRRRSQRVTIYSLLIYTFYSCQINDWRRDRREAAQQVRYQKRCRVADEKKEEQKQQRQKKKRKKGQ